MAVKRRQAGTRRRISAGGWNFMAEQTERFALEEGGPRIPAALASGAFGLIDVKNSSGSTCQLEYVLGLGAPVRTPTADPKGFRVANAFAGSTPSASSHRGKFCIVQQDLVANEVGVAVVSGPTWVNVDVLDESHGFADVKDGDATQLQSGDSGAAKILWKPSGTGTKRCYVLLGIEPSASSVLRAYYIASGVENPADNRVIWGSIPCREDGLTVRQDSNRQIKFLTAGDYMMDIRINAIVEWNTSGAFSKRVQLQMTINGVAQPVLRDVVENWAVNVLSGGSTPHTHSATTRPATDLMTGGFGHTTYLHYRAPVNVDVDDYFEILVLDPGGNSIDVRLQQSFIEFEPLF
jgi:hypothetical protein